MGFLNYVFNKLTGTEGAKSDGKKEMIRNIFNSKVPNGEGYTVLACGFNETEKKLMKEVRYNYNYIVGYKDGDDPEVVIIPTNAGLSDVGDPVCCKKSACRKNEFRDNANLFTISHPDLGDKPVSFYVIVSAGFPYMISVNYLDEFAPFMEFFKNRFAK